MDKIVFDYHFPMRRTITMPQMRKALKDVQQQLLSHQINGGAKHFDMGQICGIEGCGMAACIGGWASIFLLGFDITGRANEYAAQLDREEKAGLASELFESLARMDTRLNELFHGFSNTHDYNEPNVAATAIRRYLNGVNTISIWPHGPMPNVMPYTKRRAAKKAVKKKKAAKK